MLELRETRIVHSLSSAILSGSLIPEEGMALAYEKENGTTCVRLTTGVAGEIFAGISLSRNTHPASLPYVQETYVPSSGTLELVRSPIAGQLLVKVAGVVLTIVSVTPVDATKVQLKGTDLVFFPGQVGKSVFAQFLYVPSIIEARMVIGDGPIGGLASTAEESIGVLKEAHFATNMFDASADWLQTIYAKTGPGGTLTVGTAEDHIPNLIVMNAPSAASPFLVCSISVA